jgi:hypothetical protein
MHYFVLMGGLLFGWRAGVIIGLLTPLTSYGLSGMPLINVLPQIAVELSAYGLIAGLLREKYNLRVIWALLGAMIGGRLALVMAISLTYMLTGQSYSPIGIETGPLQAFWIVIKQGWPGLLIQLAVLPIIIVFVEKRILSRLRTHDE